MKKIKILIINFSVLLVIISIFEIGAGISRILIGKDFIPLFSQDWLKKDENLLPPSHPCFEMKTDVLLSHVPNNPNRCNIKYGKSIGEYVVYNFASKNLPKILTLGGSTTSGYYHHSVNGNTYPKHLAKKVSKSHFLINGGVGGYSSMQEFLKFYRDGSRFKNLKIVVVLNGLNDLPNFSGNTTDENNKKELLNPFLSSTQNYINSRQIWVDKRINKSFIEKIFINLTPNLKSLLRYIFLGGSKIEKNKNLYKKNNNENNILNNVMITEQWEKNIIRLNELVKIEGAQLFVFLQPTLGLEGVQSNPAPLSNDKKIFDKIDSDYLQTLRVTYSEMKKKCSKLSFCIDISSAVGPTGDIYADKRHFTGTGNILLAEEIYKYIKEYL